MPLVSVSSLRTMNLQITWETADHRHCTTNTSHHGENVTGQFSNATQLRDTRFAVDPDIRVDFLRVLIGSSFYKGVL